MNTVTIPNGGDEAGADEGLDNRIISRGLTWIGGQRRQISVVKSPEPDQLFTEATLSLRRSLPQRFL